MCDRNYFLRTTSIRNLCGVLNFRNRSNVTKLKRYLWNWDYWHISAKIVNIFQVLSCYPPPLSKIRNYLNFFNLY